MSLPFRATELVHDWVRHRLGPGDLAVDATAGNGHDTRFLAELVGPGGHVYAFDVQEEALEAALRRLKTDGLAGQVTLIHAGHESMEEHLAGLEGTVRAILFNLGYLPGGDHAVTTRPQTTLAAVETALPLLAPGGLLTLACYRGHPGGAEETDALLRFCRGLAPTQYRSCRCDVLNFEQPPPLAIAIERR